MANVNSNQFCYVASGLQFAKFLYKEALADPKTTELVGKWFERLNHSNDHVFSVLFNAFTEKKMGPVIENTLKPYVYDVHADSGGLQMISRGMQMTPEVKKQIYATQGRYSDVAMSFDEIPVYTLVQKSVLKDAGNKVFDRSMLIPCAKETAKNLTEQIQFFLDSKTKTRPLAIIQGNCLETARIWADTLFKEVPANMHEAIGGIAIGSPALGVGELEEVKKAFWFTQIPFDIKDKHLHMLGVGAMRRILPTLVFAKSGLFQDTFISYDSTTHTSCNIYGRYYYGKKHPNHQVVYKRPYCQKYKMMYDDIIEFLPELGEYVKDSHEFHHVLNANPAKYVEEHGTRIPMILATNAHAISCMNNFTKHVSDALHDDETLFELADVEFVDKKTKQKHIDKTKRAAYLELGRVKNLNDYTYWETHLGRYLESKPSRCGHTTLDDFF